MGRLPGGGQAGARPKWRLEPYGRGWRLAATTVAPRRETVLWFTGHRIRIGGEIVVAPDRHYDLRSRILKRLDAHIVEDENLLVEAHAIPLGKDRAEVDVNVHRPDHHDAALLATFAAVHGLLVYRQGRLLRAHGRDGDHFPER